MVILFRFPVFDHFPLKVNQFKLNYTSKDRASFALLNCIFTFSLNNFEDFVLFFSISMKKKISKSSRADDSFLWVR